MSFLGNVFCSSLFTTSATVCEELFDGFGAFVGCFEDFFLWWGEFFLVGLELGSSTGVGRTVSFSLVKALEEVAAATEDAAGIMCVVRYLCRPLLECLPN
jgi:hypothetical protein